MSDLKWDGDRHDAHRQPDAQTKPFICPSESECTSPLFIEVKTIDIVTEGDKKRLGTRVQGFRCLGCGCNVPLSQVFKS